MMKYPASVGGRTNIQEMKIYTAEIGKHND